MLAWNQTYAIGNRFIDAEHRILFDIANELTSKGLDSVEKFKEVYLELLQYTNLHFQNEEMLLKEIGYSHLLGHSQSHREITNDMRNLVLQRHSLDELTMGLTGCLQHWIGNHILREDMAYRSSLAEWKHRRIGT